MAEILKRLFGKKEPAVKNPSAPPPPPPRQIPHRIPAALSAVPLAEISLKDAKAASPSFLDLRLDTSVITPPVQPSEFGSYTVVDVETTGLDPVSGEILEVSALRFEDFKPVSLFTALTRPLHFRTVPPASAAVNRITDFQMNSAVYFHELRDGLQGFLSPASVIVGHNLPFDIKFLFKSGIHFPTDVLYIDTCYNAKKYLGKGGLSPSSRLSSFRLEDLCKYYNITFEDAHFSASDCLATGLLFKALLEDMATYEEPKPDYIPSEYIAVKQFSPRCELDPSSPLFGKKIAFTGELSIDRREAMQLAVDAGMKLMNSVTKRTDYLVRGTYLNPEYQSSKYKKAVEFNDSGEGNIQILDETGFSALIGMDGEE